ncbi:DUF2637 domain-containing protein [Streptomyces sp. NPDC001351]|uniref:DUF2637 domain-containing protein n=1 Tax=Streptomyces sp. NPDC001351 TaxID=3364564 RepID=UPI003687AAE3
MVVLALAVIVGSLSFSHLHDLAAAAGQGGWKAWAYPLSVDLLLVCVMERLRADRSASAGFWCLVAMVASLGANVATAGLLDLAHPPAWLRILVAGWPAIAFLGSILLAHAPTEAGDRVPVPPAPAAPAPAPNREPEPAPTAEPAAALVAEEPPALPAPAADPEPPAVPVPPALVAHARKVADEHRV